MNEKLKKLEDKVLRVQDVVKETVQFSDRTYFMEEARRFKAEKARFEQDKGIYKDKLKASRKRIGDLEALITEYAQRDSGHIVGAHFG